MFSARRGVGRLVTRRSLYTLLKDYPGCPSVATIPRHRPMSVRSTTARLSQATSTDKNKLRQTQAQTNTSTDRAFPLVPGVPSVPPAVAHRFSALGRILVFSDLHCTAKTAGVCTEILQHVHRAAAERDAGIIFLGDFWHERGMLPVEALNMMSRELATWTQPAIFLTGNHDQVSEAVTACMPSKRRQHACRRSGDSMHAVEVVTICTLYSVELRWYPSTPRQGHRTRRGSLCSVNLSCAPIMLHCGIVPLSKHRKRYCFV